MQKEIFKVTNFRKWRLKKVLAFLICMAFSLSFMLFYKNDNLNTVFLLAGLFVYGFIMRCSFISDNSSYLEVLEENDGIRIQGMKAETYIHRGSIINMETKEIRYGGRWLDVIGKRLIVHTNAGTYHFDFEISEDKENIDNEQDFAVETPGFSHFEGILKQYVL